MKKNVNDSKSKIGKNERTSERLIIVKEKSGNLKSNFLYTVKTMHSQNAFRIFFESYSCYDIIPVNSKILILDSNLPLRTAFNSLLNNNLKVALIWDNKSCSYYGVLTLSDFMQIISYFYHYGRKDNISELDNWTIDMWRNSKNDCATLVSITTNDSIHDGIKLILSEQVRQLAVVDKKTGNAIHFLNYKGVLKFLFTHLHQLPIPKYLSSTIDELNIGSLWNVFTVFGHQKLLEVWNLLLENRKSTVPVLDKEHNIIGLYSKIDAINVLNSKTFSILDATVSDALKLSSNLFSGVYTCRKNETLHAVITKLVNQQIHSLVIVSLDCKVIGILTLSDVMEYINREFV